MGGNAFKQLLPGASFPRMHPAVYNALKAQLLPIVQSLYTHVTVSLEAPEKVDYGDLDFIVAGPREGLTHEEIVAALHATCSVPQGGNRTSNFAVPLSAFQGVADAEASCSEDAQVFAQVDINMNADHEQWERTVFWSSYGDLGFFLGLFAHTAGLSFSVYGTKLADPIPTLPARTYWLSTSMGDLLSFFGLSIDRWQQGFATRADLFAWLATSPFVHVLAARYRSPDYKPSTKEGAYERPMRASFVRYLQTHDVPASRESLFAQEGNIEEKVQAALKFFGKDKEHAALIYLSRVQKRSKELLNGTNVMEWTGVAGMPVRYVLDEVKERLSRLPAQATTEADEVKIQVEAWQRALMDMQDEDVRMLVVSVKEEMAVDGRLAFDWKSAKAARLEKKQQQLKGVAAGASADASAVVVAAA